MPKFSEDKQHRITAEVLKQHLHYNPDTGAFTRVGPYAYYGKVGALSTRGHLRIKVLGHYYYAHRLAWLYMYVEWPTLEIDHVNMVHTDNRIENLRQASSKQNQENKKLFANNTSGFRGVVWNKQSGKWVAEIRHNGKKKHLGSFTDPAEAGRAAKAARDKLFTHHST